MTLTQFLKSQPELLSRIAELMTVNGGAMKPAPKGPPTKSENKYGRVNLTIEEAMELEFYRGTIQGFVAATEDMAEVEAFKELIRTEITGSSIQIATPEQTKEILNVPLPRLPSKSRLKF